MAYSDLTAQFKARFIILLFALLAVWGTGVLRRAGHSWHDAQVEVQLDGMSPPPAEKAPPADQAEVRAAVAFYLEQAEQAAAAGDARMAEAATLEAWREANRFDSRDEILAVQDRCWKINAKAQRR